MIDLKQILEPPLQFQEDARNVSKEATSLVEISQPFQELQAYVDSLAVYGCFMKTSRYVISNPFLLPYFVNTAPLTHNMTI